MLRYFKFAVSEHFTAYRFFRQDSGHFPSSNIFPHRSSKHFSHRSSKRPAGPWISPREIVPRKLLDWLGSGIQGPEQNWSCLQTISFIHNQTCSNRDYSRIFPSDFEKIIINPFKVLFTEDLNV